MPRLKFLWTAAFALTLIGPAWAAGNPASSAAGASAVSQVPLEDFFRRGALGNVVLSPDGDKLAMLVPGPEGRNVLVVAPVSDPGKRVGVARFDDADINFVDWVNNKRLVLSLYDSQEPLGEQKGNGLYAVNDDGSEFVFLVGRGREVESTGNINIRPLRANHRLVSVLQDGSNDVLVVRGNFLRHRRDTGSVTLLRLNTLTKETKAMVADPPENAVGWRVNFDLEPVVAQSVLPDSTVKIWARQSKTDPWKAISEYSLYNPKAGALDPVGPLKDGRWVVSAVRGDAEETLALYHYDLSAGKTAEQPFMAVKGHDLEGGLIYDWSQRELLGVRYATDAAGTAWLHPQLKSLQARVDALLTGTNNLLACGMKCLSQKHFVVAAYSDRQPAVFFLFDPSKEGPDALSLIGASRPWIDSRQMASQDVVRVKARDGLSMPVYITKPAGKGPWPTVVMVHGGPYVRGHAWGWSPDSQFLASRGYLVVEPEFRGSTGYGQKHFRAGWKQWGLAMQDDVTDVTQWAVAQGMADPKRLVIAGGSYGGYATMMGLVKEPELYRAGINWVGVTDIELMYQVGWSDFADSIWQRLGMPVLVGDLDKDRAQFDKTSPLKRAAEITKPVLMMYGEKDLRVPLPHGEKMRDALKAAGKVKVEWVEYEGEGHGFMLEKNRFDSWRRVEAFLAQHTR
jgi:dipeptidyl aminopeptidase/acylaminoacyl peptidase